MQSFDYEGEIKGFFDSRYCFAAKRDGIKLATSLIAGDTELKIKIIEEKKEFYDMAKRFTSENKGANPVMQARALKLATSGMYIEIHDDNNGTRNPLVNILPGESETGFDPFAMQIMREELEDLKPMFREALMLFLYDENMKQESLARGLSQGVMARRANRGFEILQQRVLERVGEQVALSK